jgi:tRNA dimethylallyltransferase
MRKETKQLPKLVVIVGPTASGKTSWSLELAEKYNGEIISADSRQIYKKMSIGTAKVEGAWKKDIYVVDGVNHYMLDFLDPGKSFTAAQFRDQAVKHIKRSIKSDKLPFLVGGTGLYVQTLIDNYDIPRVPPNKKLRSSLEAKDAKDLVDLLKQLDPKIVETIDKKNKRRLVRALEVCIFTGLPFSEQRLKNDPIFDVLVIGVDVPRELLYDRIEHRVDDMIDNGLEKEIRGLRRQKYSWDMPSMLGIGYRQFRDYLDGDEPIEAAIKKLKRDTKRFARRQLTWFRRDKRIKWVSTCKDADKLIREFLKD